MKYIKLIIFDLDGTLIDSKKDIARGVNFALKEVGFEEKGFSEIYSYIGMGVEDLIRKALDGEKGDIFQKALSIFKDYYRQHATDNSRLYAGTEEVLEYFKDKKKAIVTNRTYEFTMDALEYFDIGHYFGNIVTGDNLGCMKPSACPLDETRFRFKIDKEKSIMVGDMDIDILSGKKAGLLTCAVTYGIGKKEDILKTKPDYIIDDILELKKIIA